MSLGFSEVCFLFFLVVAGAGTVVGVLIIFREAQRSNRRRRPSLSERETELDDLQATLRQLERFRQQRVERPEALDPLFRLVEARLGVLDPRTRPKSSVVRPSRKKQHRPEHPPSPQPVPETLSRASKLADFPKESTPSEPKHPTYSQEQVAPIPPTSEDASIVSGRLNQLLGTKPPASLSSTERVQVVMLFGQSTAKDLKSLPAIVLHRLGQILEQLNRRQDALNVYTLCLADNPTYPEVAIVAIAAASLAIDLRLSTAAGNLDRAELLSTAHEEREQCQRLRERLDPRPTVKETLPPKPVPSKPQQPPGLPTTPPMPLPPAQQQPTIERPPTETSRSTTEEERSSDPVTQSPAQGWGKLLSAFMEERNILWGELLGGLLIVGGSIALVISLWPRLEANPYSPFGVFGSITVALLGAGLYSHRRWKLEATSRGLLVIGTLLVPLTFLVLPGMLRGGRAGPWELSIGGCVLALFGWLVSRAGRVLIPGMAWTLSFAVLGCCGMQVLSGWAVTGIQDYPVVLLAIGLGIVAVHGLPLTWGNHLSRAQLIFGVRESGGLFALVGLSTFSLAVCFGFLMARSYDVASAVKLLAPFISLSGVPVIIGGFVVHSRLVGNRELVSIRTIGTAVLVSGVTIMLSGMILAWPGSISLVIVATINWAVLSWVSFRYGLPILQAPALVCLGLGLCLVPLWEQQSAGLEFNVLQTQVLQHLGSMTAAVYWAFFALTLCAASEIFLRMGRLRDGICYICVAAGTAFVGSVLSLWHGVSDPTSTAVVFGVVALGSLGMNLRWKRAWISYVGTTAVTTGLLWGSYGWVQLNLGYWSSAIAAESLVFALMGYLLSRKDSSNGQESPQSSFRTGFGTPFVRSAEMMAVCSVLFAGVSGWLRAWEEVHIATGFLVVAVYFLLTILEKRHSTATLSGAILIGTAFVWTDLLTRSVPGGLTPEDRLGILGCVAVGSALTLQMLSTFLDHWLPKGENKHWARILIEGWREIILTSSVLGFWWSVSNGVFVGSSLPPYSFLILATTSLFLTSQYRQSAFTWFSSGCLLVSLTMVFNKWLGELEGVHYLLPTILGFLFHATIMTLSGLVPGALFKEKLSPAMLRYTGPSRYTGLISSWLVVPIIFFQTGAFTTALSTGWLAVLWIVVSWHEQRRSLFACGQLTACVAVVHAVKLWLTEQDWVRPEDISGFFDPRSLQTLGLALAGLSGVFTLSRILFGRTNTGKKLLAPDLPGLDRILLGGLLIGCLGLVDWGIAKAVGLELYPDQAARIQALWPEFSIHAYGVGSWLLAGALTVVLTVSLWQPAPTQRRSEAMIGFVVLTAICASLIAGRADSGYVTFTLVCGLGTAFALCSVIALMRKSVGGIGRNLGVYDDSLETLHSQFRTAALDVIALPSIGLVSLYCGVVLWEWLAFGFDPGRPFADLRMWPWVSLLFGFGGLFAIHGLREKSGMYVFSGGLVVTLGAGMIYSLFVAGEDRPFTPFRWVELLQVLTIVTGTWTVGWFAVRRRVQQNDGTEPSWLSDRLVSLQLAFPVLGNAALLVGGIYSLSPAPALPFVVQGFPVFFEAGPWTSAAGTYLGWICFGVTCLAVSVRPGWRLVSHDLGWIGLGLAMLVACSVELINPTSGYRGLMVTVSLFSIVWSVLPLVIRRFTKPDGNKVNELSTTSFVWVCIGTSLSTALAIFATLTYHDHFWTSGVMATVGVCLVLVGLQRRDEVALTWASGAFNAAALVAVWHVHLNTPIREWWMTLVYLLSVTNQVIVIGWLILAHQLRKTTTGHRPFRPWLPLQVVLGNGTVLLFTVTCFFLTVIQPERPPFSFFETMGSNLGLVALTLTVLSLGWFVTITARGQLVHYVGAVSLLVPVHAAALVSPIDNGSWLCFHLLAATLAMSSFVLLLVGGTVARSQEVRESSAGAWTSWVYDAFPRLAIQRWVEVGLFVVGGLGMLCAINDPTRPLWAFGLLTLTLVGYLAHFLWVRREGVIQLIGTYVTLMGVVVWVYVPPTLEYYLGFIIVPLSASAILTAALQPFATKRDSQNILPSDWQGLVSILFVGGLLLFYLLLGIYDFEFGSRQVSQNIEGLPMLFQQVMLWGTLVPLFLCVGNGKSPSPRRRVISLPFSFSRGAVVLGLIVFVVLVFPAMVVRGLQIPAFPSESFWTAYSAVMIAALVCALDHRARSSAFSALPLYLGGLIGVLSSSERGGPADSSSFAITLAVFQLTAGVIGWSVVGLRGWWFRRSSESRPTWRTQAWLIPCQGVISLLSVGLAFYSVLTLQRPEHRFAAPIAVTILVVGTLVLSRVMERTASNTTNLGLTKTTLILSTLVMLLGSWAALAPTEEYVSLYRHTLWLTVISSVCFVFVFGIRLRLPLDNNWQVSGEKLARVYWLQVSGEKLARVYWLLSLVSTFTCMGHLGYLRVFHDGPVEIGAWAAWFLVVVLLAMGIGATTFAIVPKFDPLGLSEERRSNYVYAAQVFMGLLLIHLQTYLTQGVPLANAPPENDLPSWLIVIMVLAFVGVGLSELFTRLKIDVLAKPFHRTGVFLPMIPLVAFWIDPVIGIGQGNLPAPDLFGGYAILWFLACGLYLLIGLANKSYGFTLIGALAGTFGIWCLLYFRQDMGVGFFRHPQLWLIPIALIILISEHANRHLLPQATRNGLRYLGLIMLYLSSAADLFIQGLEDVVWSIVLAVLAISGILMGIQLRVRSFLFVGFTFLILVIGARVWHAAVDQEQNWVWWAVVISLGIVILTVFAVFEKRRMDVLRLFDELKRWE